MDTDKLNIDRLKKLAGINSATDVKNILNTDHPAHHDAVLGNISYLADEIEAMHDGYFNNPDFKRFAADKGMAANLEAVINSFNQYMMAIEDFDETLTSKIRSGRHQDS